MDPTPRALPTGGCNFCDLTQGVALTCGCQRFWCRKRKRGNKVAAARGEGGIEESTSKGSIRGKGIDRIGRIKENDRKSSFVDNDDDDDDEDCHCGHHVCYHSFESSVPTLTQPTGRRYSLQISDAEASLRPDRSASNLAASGFSITSGTTTERDYSTATEPSPSGVASRHLKQHHTYQSSHLGTDPSASRSSSRVTGRGEGRGEIEHVLQSALEFFLSKIESLLSQCQQASSTTAAVLANSAEIAQFNTKLTKLIEVFEQLQQSSRSHHERLETVETFGSIIEEIRDKVELTEDRANEVEEKVFSFENRLDDRLIECLVKSHKEKRKIREREVDEDGSLRAQKRRRGLEREPGTLIGSSQQEIKTTTTASFTTSAGTSTSSSGTATSESRGVTVSRLLSDMERFELRLVKIEKNAAPTPEIPWVIEVVLLPPAPLRGIWIDGPGSVGGYESSNPQSISTFSGACSSRRQSHEYDDGPLPRSFGVNSRLYRRLSTRGFIKDVHVLGPTGQDVATAVDLNFGGLLNWCHSFYGDDSASPRPPSTQHSMVSLNWQPLRKAHKQTSLEYLKPGEMMEAMWTVEFLKGSCIMKGRRGVLYITPLFTVHPASIPSYSGISWGDIKALPEYRATEEVGEDIKPPGHLQLDLESAEESWEWKETLDGIPKARTAPPLARSGSPGSWSSFGPFQLEDETRLSNMAQRTLHEEEQRQGATPPETVAGSGSNGHHSPGLPSPPTPLHDRKHKPPSPLEDGGCRIREARVQRRLRRQQRESPGFALEGVAIGIEGLTPALTTRGSSYLPSPTAASGRASIARQGSGLSGLSVFSGFSAGGDWELSPRTLVWLTEHPVGGEDVVEEEKSEGLAQEEPLSEDKGVTAEDTVEESVWGSAEEAFEDGDGGYASMLDGR